MANVLAIRTVVSQLLYSAGASGFAGANGSMMIEVVVRHLFLATARQSIVSRHRFQPFFHILAQSISAYIGEDKPHEILATTMVAFAFSSVLTGICYLPPPLLHVHHD